MVSSVLVLSLLAVDSAPFSVAAPPWSVVNVHPELATFYADQLAGAMRARGVRVLSASDIVALVGLERQRQLLGCGDSGCIAEIGNALGCDGALLVSFAKLDDSLRAHLRIISIKDAKVLVETRVDEVGERAFADALERAAFDLTTPWVGPLEPRAPPGVGWVWATGIASLVTAAVGVGFALVASDRYQATLRATSVNEALVAANVGKPAQTASLISFGVASAAAIMTGVLLFWRSTVRLAVVPTVNGASFVFCGLELP
jgi:hypothetical protein